MYGLFCKDKDCSIIPSSESIDIINILSSCNSPYNKKYIEEYINFNQSTCSICSENYLKDSSTIIENLIIVLECGHVFHLNCFINYIKWKYIEEQENDNIDKHKNKSSKSCSLCRSDIPDFVLIFSTYVKLLQNIKKIKKDFYAILN
jgi:hypothetical protein